LVLSVGVVLHSLQARADTTSTWGDFGGEGLQPFGGLAQAPEADLFTGNFTIQVPILIPPGRKNATPELKLVYSSAGGDGPFGRGWSLPLGSIERSTKFGVPRCLGLHTDDFILTLNGAVQELIAVSGSTTNYRVKIDESYMEVTANRTNNRWEVKDRAGMTYTFGDSSNSRVFKGAEVFMVLMIT
jgi:hypothetical protein